MVRPSGHAIQLPVNQEAEIEEYFGEFSTEVVRPWWKWEAQYFQYSNQSAVGNLKHKLRGFAL